MEKWSVLASIGYLNVMRDLVRFHVRLLKHALPTRPAPYREAEASHSCPAPTKAFRSAQRDGWRFSPTMGSGASVKSCPLAGTPSLHYTNQLGTCFEYVMYVFT